MLSERDWNLVRHATGLAESLGEHDDHTVVSAAYDESGEIVTGVNAYHFTGGPCAELVLLGRAAERAVPVRVETIVAVMKRTGAVISPCGRCRQVLFDYHQQTRVVVHGPNGLEAVGIRELLPHAFDWHAYEPGGPGPALHMHPAYLDAVRAGAKTTTVRVHDPVSPGPVRLVFDGGGGTSTRIDAVVTEVRAASLRELTDEDARRDGFDDRQALLEALELHYPGIAPATRVDVVRFETAR
ncbi:ASCH domain-containing protein [Saccharopolyspora erythraea]|uniref:ASCH domain-containing protein n=1 Tax=Saccharopolyspora erythraea TaxID=1836 RepID=UPI001BA88B14|nr:ASCH domain-containing protein [Saccharopolyspora erythraea]QUH01739.1 ASCH domain-containing protein [Saccharopolyspora erythraea]